MRQNLLVTLTKEFAVDTIRLCGILKETKRATVLSNQLLKSGTSIGANVHEANYAASKSDFINKLQIALKECYETAYWLEIFHEAEIVTQQEYEGMYGKCSKIRAVLQASIITAKKNLNKVNDFSWKGGRL